MLFILSRYVYLSFCFCGAKDHAQTVPCIWTFRMGKSVEAVSRLVVTGTMEKWGRGGAANGDSNFFGGGIVEMFLT